MRQPLDALARKVADLLSQQHKRIVFAESCTAGLVSATLARIPGISQFHCGSLVVYRIATKIEWLDVAESILISPGPVSEPVARLMAESALQRTPEADLAASITGHLGPDAPDEQDGLIFIGVTVRGGTSQVFEHRLPKIADPKATEIYPGSTEREQRQWMAVEFVLTHVDATIRGIAGVSE